ncbi:MAG: HAD hydrolase family protein [Proteobacteria bacterium]|nr:HAD hydrolase family protein [Pseudomonadota bacterium]MBU1715725.1 HAD hydrolase family protein [Pseudomonadota bacterium]
MNDDDQCPVSGTNYPSDCAVTQGLRENAAARQSGGERSYAWRAALPKASKIKLLLLDVDGVLTDGSLYFTPEGTEMKAFSSKDGLGLRLVQKAGVEIGLITARTSEAVRCRAENLGLTHVYQGESNKIAVYEKLLTELSLTPEEVAFVGDDWLDLPLLIRVGFAATVADAVPEVLAVVHYVAKNPGGRGAVREICDLIVEAKGKREELLAGYLKK